LRQTIPSGPKQQPMRPDNTAPIIAAARQRHELTRAKAIQALRELDRAGTPVTFQTVAAAAQVSRSWLYSQPDIRAEIQRLRRATCRPSSLTVPVGQRASDSSLRTRLEAALERNRALSEELGRALGERRTSPSTDTAPSLPERSGTGA
jgi:hypothetical protein